MCLVVADVGAAEDVVSLSASDIVGAIVILVMVIVGVIVVTLGAVVAVFWLGVMVFGVLLTAALDVTECWLPVKCFHVVVCFTGLMSA